MCFRRMLAARPRVLRVTEIFSGSKSRSIVLRLVPIALATLILAIFDTIVIKIIALDYCRRSSKITMISMNPSQKSDFSGT
jgi:hypothetical protein